jgi:predicted sugar kinase
MARYLFQADYRGVTATDDIGEEFSTLQEAEAHAEIVANELGRNTSGAVTVSVLNEDGILVTSGTAAKKYQA